MSGSRVIASTAGRRKAEVRRSTKPLRTGANKVLAERNQAVAAVGAWVEGGEDIPEHPTELALLTDELQAERRRETEESLRRFQDEVRHRVAQISKRRQPFPKTDSVIKPDRRTPQQQQQRQVWTRYVPSGEKKLVSASPHRERPVSRVTERSTQQQEPGEGMRQVRLRLAACRMSPRGEVTSDLPGGQWNISPSRHKGKSDVEEEGEEEEGDLLFSSQHECPLVQQNVSSSSAHHGLVGEGELWDTDRTQPDSGSKSSLRDPHVLWPQVEQDELKRQRQSQFLMHRRLYMNIEREQVKENKQHRKHLKRTARIKAEKEQIRLEEERKLERAQQLAEAQKKLEERELLILEQLKLEEEERVAELERRKKQQKGKVTERFIEALRARMKKRLSQEKLDLPPLCCCASSFWDSHPDTCANNCVFHNNPKAYAQALHSAMLSLDSH